ncbi:fructose-2,6-bisphosphatase TIGAR [Rhinatrema bivittatum]|uniref:fructose-2,6-bisphosphatase TIGAR n=1 Tax=Rhinatrema bivittatum TaxID=194408 RepID=UPI0011264348|nr:fructose-2,6-bisphosphatase TIGAR [Rhinatrema bivittatum]
MVRFALTLVRHGETRYNKEKLLQGQGVDEPLSDTGFRQADAAGKFLGNVKFTHVFSSDLIRAKQTAATILGNNKLCQDLEIHLDVRLRERRYGEAEGRPLSELRAMAKTAGEQCPSYTPPGGETLEQVRTRVKDFFQFLCQLMVDEEAGRTGEAGAACSSREAAPEPSWPLKSLSGSPGTNCPEAALLANVLLVSHGAYMRNWLLYFMNELQCSLPGDPRKAREPAISPNTGISHFIVSLKGGEPISPEVQCLCVNQHEHLADLTAS